MSAMSFGWLGPGGTVVIPFGSRGLCSEDNAKSNDNSFAIFISTDDRLRKENALKLENISIQTLLRSGRNLLAGKPIRHVLSDGDLSVSTWMERAQAAIYNSNVDLKEPLRYAIHAYRTCTMDKPKHTRPKRLITFRWKHGRPDYRVEKLETNKPQLTCSGNPTKLRAYEKVKHLFEPRVGESETGSGTSWSVAVQPLMELPAELIDMVVDDILLESIAIWQDKSLIVVPVRIAQVDRYLRARAIKRFWKKFVYSIEPPCHRVLAYKHLFSDPRDEKTIFRASGQDATAIFGCDSWDQFDENDDNMTRCLCEGGQVKLVGFEGLPING